MHSGVPITGAYVGQGLEFRLFKFVILRFDMFCQRDTGVAVKRTIEWFWMGDG
jgi:hypothetical protein